MYSLFIADDSPMIIRGLKKLPFSDLSVSLQAICQNGFDAAQYIKNNHPDIVITDIEMPGMNGIELIKDALSAGVTSKFIILSGHDEFSFAQEAINLGVVDYLLKPVIPSQLISSIQKAVSQLDSETRTRNEKNEMYNLIKSTLPFAQSFFLDELFHGREYSETEFTEKCTVLNMQLCGKHYRCLSVSLKNFFMTELAETQSSSLQSVFSEIISLFPNCHSKVSSEKLGYLLACFSPDESPSDEQLAAKLNPLVVDLKHKYNISLSIGVSSNTTSFKEIPKIYSEADHCLRLDSNENKEAVSFYNSTSLYTTANIFQIFDQQRLERFLLDEDYLVARFYIESVLKKANNHADALNYAKKLSADIFFVVYQTLSNTNRIFVKNDSALSEQIFIINSIKTFDDLLSFFKGTFDSIQESIASQPTNRNQKTVQAIIAYTKFNFVENLTAEKLSTLFNISPTQLRKIFLEQTGETYKEYLTKVRMNEAQILLAKGTYKVYEVADMVGYKKIDHFSKLYKQYYGTTPTQKA